MAGNQSGGPAGRPVRAGSAAVAGAALEGAGLYRLLVESVRDYAIFALDRDGCIVSWNPGAARFKGYAADEIIGQHFSVFYPEVDKRVGKPAWELEVATREGRFEEEGWRLRKDGTRFWASVVITALRGEDGEVVGFAKVTRDLTERREANDRALEDARRVAAAEGANRAKGEFLAAMSHELRTPLNAIGGYAELLEMGLAGAVTNQQAEYIERIRHSQRHLLGIINDLLNYSRIEAGQLRYDIESIAVNEILAAVAPLVDPQAALKGVAFDCTSCPPALRVRADRLKAEQVVLNLLSNAIKFTPAGGHVSLACAPAGDTVAISVRDTGPGIPRDRREDIFEPFVQLGRRHSAPGEGTGLGLAISRRLARAMCGDITVGGEAGEGATFVVTLPRA